jgi:hypothetical protein
MTKDEALQVVAEYIDHMISLVPHFCPGPMLIKCKECGLGLYSKEMIDEGQELLWKAVDALDVLRDEPPRG